MKGKEKSTAQPANADLPPQVQADQCLLEAEQALQNSDNQTAKTAFKKIESLNIEEPPPEFFFLYGKFLMENCNVVNLAKAVENGQVQNFLDNLLKARSLLKQFLAQVQRTAANYKPALELLSTCQSIIKAIRSAAKEFEELAIIKNKRAGETFLIHLAACYSELVNTIVSAEDCASSARIQEASYSNEVVESLLADIADFHAKNDNGETPIHSASYYGRIEVVKALLAAGANVNAKNEYDETPLHVAAEKGQVGVVEALLEAGADVNAKDKYGETPLNKEVAEILRDAVKKTKLK